MGSKLNDFRKRRNLSIEEFAEILGCSISLLTKILYGEKKPARTFIEKFKKVFPEFDVNIFFEN